MIINKVTETNDDTKFYNPDDIVAIIKDNIDYIIDEGPNKDYYSDSGIEFLISNEQMYIPDEDRELEPNKIFVVIRLMSATLDFNQVILPFTLTVLSEKNNVDIAQMFLLEYSQTFNLTNGQGHTIGEGETGDSLFMFKQTYDAPTVSSNFNEVYDGYRSILVLTGNILINYDVYPIESLTYLPNYDDNGSDTGSVVIKTLSNAFAYGNTLDSQAYSGKNRTESISRYGTLSLSFTCYSENNLLIKTCIKMALQQRDRSVNGQNNVNVDKHFWFKLKFYDLKDSSTDDDTFILCFRLNNFDYSQAIGQFPSLSFSFTE